MQGRNLGNIKHLIGDVLGTHNAQLTGWNPVARKGRGLPSEGKGHTFESCRVRQYYQVLSQFWLLSIIARVTVVSLPDFRASTWNHKWVLRPILRDGRFAASSG
jgi:hypothetical protein